MLFRSSPWRPSLRFVLALVDVRVGVGGVPKPGLVWSARLPYRMVAWGPETLKPYFGPCHPLPSGGMRRTRCLRVGTGRGRAGGRGVAGYQRGRCRPGPVSDVLARAGLGVCAGSRGAEGPVLEPARAWHVNVAVVPPVGTNVVSRFSASSAGSVRARLVPGVTA